MTDLLNNRRILLIISGGIAAYKALDLIRLLRKDGASVSCILTHGGSQFITPLAVGALSGEPVLTDLFSLKDEQAISHIRLAREADLVVIAPATANRMAKLAHGIADDLASTVLLATDKPILMAPAMNVMMWNNPATKDNLWTLLRRGIHCVGPEVGMLACGEEGAGRMSSPEAIFEGICAILNAVHPLRGKRALVTSGPTYEPIDPVRFIGNRSSGKTGYAIAEALAEAGAETILVTGPTALPDPPNVKVVHVETAKDMHAACLAEKEIDIAICAAAVADWRPLEQAAQKIKKGEGAPVIALAENPDILAALSKNGPQRPSLVVGFAAETEDCVAHARLKLKRKGCDWILANEVGNGKAFGQDINQMVLLCREEDDKIAENHWPEMSKHDIGVQLVKEIAAALSDKQDMTQRKKKV